MRPWPKGSTCAAPPSEASSQVIAAVEACVPIFNRERLDVQECIACGAEGCTFKLVGDRIAKVTFMPEEAIFSAHLLTMRDVHPSLPVIYSVWSLPIHCDPKAKETPFLIVREDIEDLPPLDDPAEFRSATHALEEAVYQTVRGKWSEEKFIDAVMDAALMVAPGDMHIYGELADLGQWLVENGLFIEDWHPGNLGVRRDGTVVVRDLGYGQVPKKKGRGWEREIRTA